MTPRFLALACLAVALTLLAMAPARAHESTDHAEIQSLLARYQGALERRDLTGVEALFVADNHVIESGKLEGSYADYRDHHIGPELARIKQFEFSEPTLAITVRGEAAWALQTYRYTLLLDDRPDPVVRQAVTTTVFVREPDGWKIAQMHTSSRAPRALPVTRLK